MDGPYDVSEEDTAPQTVVPQTAAAPQLVHWFRDQQGRLVHAGPARVWRPDTPRVRGVGVVLLLCPYGHALAATLADSVRDQLWTRNELYGRYPLWECTASTEGTDDDGHAGHAPAGQ